MNGEDVQGAEGMDDIEGTDNAGWHPTVGQNRSQQIRICPPRSCLNGLEGTSGMDGPYTKYGRHGAPKNPNSQTFSVGGGLSKLKLPLSSTCSVSSRVTRSGFTTLDFAPSGFDFKTNPPSYNFNAFVASSPA